MTHENYKDLLAAQVLTALAADDARLLNSHVESCAECRSEMSELENVTALLAYSAEPLEPSTKVRERILASVRAEDQSDRSARDPVSPNNVRLFAAQPRNVWVSLGSFGAIAAALVFVAMMIALVTLWQKNRSTQNELARLTAQINETKAQVDRDRAMGELLTSPGGKMAKLAGTNVAPGAQAMLAYDKSGHAMLMAKGLPSAPEGMAYQLWYIKDNKKMPGKVFTPDALGSGMLEDQIPDSAREAAIFAITLEPKAGVQVPTGSIYLLSSS
ncbi:MAG TPA: anti-sigma factor [Pyrinomonadaceae bacterium]|nr:anti-sigma factor [Pyrinomonadaceae bacterium]